MTYSANDHFIHVVSFAAGVGLLGGVKYARGYPVHHVRPPCIVYAGVNALMLLGTAIFTLVVFGNTTINPCQDWGFLQDWDKCEGMRAAVMVFGVACVALQFVGEINCVLLLLRIGSLSTGITELTVGYSPSEDIKPRVRGFSIRLSRPVRADFVAPASEQADTA